MFVVIGIVIVLGCVFGAYASHGGELGVLWQPSEFIIIFGAGIGGFVVGNPLHIIKGAGKGFGAALKGPVYTKAHYVELLSMMFELFRLAKQKGAIALEPHVENPDSSDIFARYPKVAKDHHLTDFLRDYLRMITLGTDNANEMETVLDAELDAHHKSDHEISAALAALADSFPAIGIVAAVLGVIHTMGSMDQPPEVLGHMIGAALVGTFAGIFLCYGIFGPIAAACGKAFEADSRIYDVMKAGIVGFMQGYAPAIVIEMARKSIDHGLRPSFYDMEAVLAK
jgi:chemotaxis protein MotA